MEETTMESEVIVDQVNDDDDNEERKITVKQENKSAEKEPENQIESEESQTAKINSKVVLEEATENSTEKGCSKNCCENSRQPTCQVRDKCSSRSGKDDEFCRQQPSSRKSRETNSSNNVGRTKRKSRSTRRRLNALAHNASLHFSDTDSEGELMTICNNHAIPTARTDPKPKISVTLEEESKAMVLSSIEYQNPNCLVSPTEEYCRSRTGSFVENLTDIDEIYASDCEMEQQQQNVNTRNSLTVNNNNENTIFGLETDVEDLSSEEPEDLITPIFIASQKLDILSELSGETVTTTAEGDGPFSVEIRNKITSRVDSMTNEEVPETYHHNSTDVIMMPTTDSEEMEMSDEEDLNEASCSNYHNQQKENVLEDLDVLLASQIVMTNLNKVDSPPMLSVKDCQDENSIGDCHTDVEEVD